MGLESFRGFRETGPWRQIHWKTDMSDPTKTLQSKNSCYKNILSLGRKSNILIKSRVYKTHRRNGSTYRKCTDLWIRLFWSSICVFTFYCYLRLPLCTCLLILLPRDPIGASHRSCIRDLSYNFLYFQSRYLWDALHDTKKSVGVNAFFLCSR